ncbi:MAG: beta-phosphoglucomutase family hydrolase [Fimbriimonadaceae bacterium]|nr:beta-phosphoglucomutase family hydrolase [Fimbriimonadaceae bacterium]
MTLSALIFDMDGTIADNMGVHNEAWVELMASQQIEVQPEAFFRDTAGMKSEAILRRYLGQAPTEEELRRLAWEKEARYREIYRPKAELMPGLQDLWEAAKAEGVKIGIATSAPPENIAMTFEALQLDRWVDAVVGADDVVHGKPDPEVFLTSAARLGADPSRCIVFEDAPVGIEAARRAKMPCVALLTSLGREEALALPGCVLAIADFQGLTLDHLARLLA